MLVHRDQTPCLSFCLFVCWSTPQKEKKNARLNNVWVICFENDSSEDVAVFLENRILFLLREYIKQQTNRNTTRESDHDLPFYFLPYPRKLRTPPTGNGPHLVAACRHHNWNIIFSVGLATYSTYQPYHSWPEYPRSPARNFLSARPVYHWSPTSQGLREAVFYFITFFTFSLPLPSASYSIDTWNSRLISSNTTWVIISSWSVSECIPTPQSS